MGPSTRGGRETTVPATGVPRDVRSTAVVVVDMRCSGNVRATATASCRLEVQRERPICDSLQVASW